MSSCHPVPSASVSDAMATANPRDDKRHLAAIELSLANRVLRMRLSFNFLNVYTKRVNVN